MAAPINQIAKTLPFIQVIYEIYLSGNYWYQRLYSHAETGNVRPDNPYYPL